MKFQEGARGTQRTTTQDNTKHDAPPIVGAGWGLLEKDSFSTEAPLTARAGGIPGRETGLRGMHPIGQKQAN